MPLGAECASNSSNLLPPKLKVPRKSGRPARNAVADLRETRRVCFSSS